MMTPQFEKIEYKLTLMEEGYTTDKTTIPEPEEPTISEDKAEPTTNVDSFVSNKSTEENNTEEGKASL